MTEPTTKTQEITTLSRDGRHIHLTLADGTRCRMTYRDAARLDFWFKPGQLVEITGQLHDGTLQATTARLVPPPSPPPRSYEEIIMIECRECHQEFAPVRPHHHTCPQCWYKDKKLPSHSYIYHPQMRWLDSRYLLPRLKFIIPFALILWVLSEIFNW